MYLCILCIVCVFYVIFSFVLCKCVLDYCHRVPTQLQLNNNNNNKNPEGRRPDETTNLVRLKIKSIIEVMRGVKCKVQYGALVNAVVNFQVHKRRDFLHHQALISLSSCTAIYSQYDSSYLTQELSFNVC